MNKKLLALIIGTTMSLPVAAADTYTVDPRHTFPGFEINHLGFSIQRGRFNRTYGKVTLAPESGTGNIQISIDTASISTGLAELEEHLRGKDFLDAGRYPQIIFTSDKLSFNKDKLVAVDGNLTLHGITKPVHLVVDYFHCGMNMIAMK
ncbi:MAG: YceI family protein, partial [Methylobacter sp.]